MNDRKILLIEDSFSQALRLQLLLQRAGYEVSIASDGAEGWRQACDNAPDLILLDVNLPTLDGFQVLTRLKFGRSTAHIPVIMLARCEYVGTIERAIALGAAAYLFKDDCLGKDDGASYLCATVSSFLEKSKAITA
jgi:DNA-binding response OmpR family regulator